MRIYLSILFVTALLVSCGKKSDTREDGHGAPTPNANNSPVGNLNAPESLGSWKYVESGTTSRINATASPIVSPYTQVFAVGDEGAFLESMDNGQTWQKRAIDTEKNLNVIKQVNSVIYIGGDGVFLLSTDNGNNFETVPGIDFTIRSIAETTSGDGAFFAAGDNGRVARASFNGVKLDNLKAADLKWESISIAGAPDLTGVSVSFYDVVVVGKGGFVAASKDIGKTFAKDDGGRTNLDFLTIDDEFMAGNGVFAKRYTPSGWPSGSISWKVLESSDLPIIHGLHCISSCMAVGENSEGGLVVKISEEGKILSTEAKGLHSRFYSIGRLLNGGLIAVGDSGKIIVRPKQD